MTSPTAPSDRTDRWTLRQLLKWTTDYFTEKAIDAPRLSAEMLLAHTLSLPRIHLYMDIDRPTTAQERQHYRSLIERVVAHEPVQYLVEQASFYGLDYHVTPDVLIPRPSTETLVNHVIQHIRQTPGFANPLIADIGTGSGCIAVTLAKNIPDAHIIATDISAEALAIAQQNAERHQVAERIEFRQGSLYEPLSHERFHFILSNPPYIDDAEWAAVEANVRDYEPTHALRGGHDGLDCLTPLVQQAAQWLTDPGQIGFEFAASQKQKMLDLAATTVGLTNAHVLADFEELPRHLIADHQAT